jgi:hypothetical protein
MLSNDGAVDMDSYMPCKKNGYGRIATRPDREKLRKAEW